MRQVYRLLALLGIIKAARRGFGPLARRQVRSVAHRSLARALRRVLKP